MSPIICLVFLYIKFLRIQVISIYWSDPLYLQISAPAARGGSEIWRISFDPNFCFPRNQNACQNTEFSAEQSAYN